MFCFLKCWIYNTRFFKKTTFHIFFWLLCRQLWSAFQSVPRSLQWLSTDHWRICLLVGWRTSFTWRYPGPRVLWNEGNVFLLLVFLFVLFCFSRWNIFFHLVFLLFFRSMRKFLLSIYLVVSQIPMWSELDGQSTTAALSLVSGAIAVWHESY